MHTVLLLKVGTEVRVTRPRFGMVGRITRVFPHLGAYWVEGVGGTFLVKPRFETIEPLTGAHAH